MIQVWNDTLTSQEQANLVDNGFYPSDWFALVTPGEEITDSFIDYIINNITRNNYDEDYLIQNTALQQINQWQKGGEKMILQPIHCGIGHWVLGTEKFGDNAIFDSSGSLFNDTIRRASAQLFEPEEGDRMTLVWRKCTSQVGLLCALHTVAHMIEILLGYNPSYIKYDQLLMRETGMNIIKQGRMIRFPKLRAPLIRKSKIVKSVRVFDASQYI